MGVDERRAARRKDIIAATRALFDERGVRDAQIEDIARSVGINRAIIYRHFSGKEELFAVTLIGYLNDLAAALAAGVDEQSDPATRLEQVTAAFFRFGIAHPAFVDCAQTLMRRRGTELYAEVGQDVMVDLGRAMGVSMSHVVRALRAGNASGDFDVPDPHLLANVLYTQGLGALNLAHLQWSVRELNSGSPAVDTVSAQTLESHLVHAAVALARGVNGA